MRAFQRGEISEWGRRKKAQQRHNKYGKIWGMRKLTVRCGSLEQLERGRGRSFEGGPIFLNRIVRNDLACGVERWRCCRNSSATEGWFGKYRKLMRAAEWGGGWRSAERRESGSGGGTTNGCHGEGGRQKGRRERGSWIQ